ncbi:hypothetical protein [Micromonospora sp. AKA38]|uniref:hypothetical protein n=1 Tax=Micromonospora sp. AKA38 TaxID=2733861 RepID=UPI0022CA2DEE|nr:hypothetical protein [Micromonospora sp. AKA38]GHJ13184.1 hypothetical protein TPA0908_11790 [Micromonospora sp. AKA38]
MSHVQRPPGRRISDPTAANVARVCADMVDVADLVDLTGPEAEPVLARLRADDATEEAVRVALDEVADLLRRHGLTGVLGAARGGEVLPDGFTGLPAIGTGRPLEEVYVCPGNLCDRTEIRRPGATAAPSCAVWARPLLLFRLDR